METKTDLSPKRKRSWAEPGEASQVNPEAQNPWKKEVLCIWWDQKEILCYELLQPGEKW